MTVRALKKNFLTLSLLPLTQKVTIPLKPLAWALAVSWLGWKADQGTCCMKDWMLVVGVLLMVVIDAVILTTNTLHFCWQGNSQRDLGYRQMLGGR